MDALCRGPLAEFVPALPRQEEAWNSQAEHVLLGTAYLEARGVTLDALSAAGGGIVSNARMLDPGFPREPAIVFRFHDPRSGEALSYIAKNGETRPFIRIRRLYDGEPRFRQPKKSGTHVYFAHLRDVSWRQVLDDASYGLVISEGETRALAGAVHDFPVIALTGVDCGQIRGRLHPDLEIVSWHGREVFLTFDSDASHKDRVQRALLRLASLLQARGAIVHQVHLPFGPDGSKQATGVLFSFDGQAARC